MASFLERAKNAAQHYQNLEKLGVGKSGDDATGQQLPPVDF